MSKPTQAQKDAAKAKAEEVRMALVASVIEAIQSDPLHWSKSWTLSHDGLPHNGATGKRYRGGNVFWFMMAAEMAGYDSQAWGTVKQWNSVGCRVRKGQHPTLGLFWKVWVKTETVMTPAGPEQVEKRLPMLRTFRVFNFAQVDIIDQDKFDRRSKVQTERPEVIEYPGEDILTAVPATLRKGSPSFSPSEDVVRMPAVADFDDPEHYATTFAHELTHWTGHKSRLDRIKFERWGDESYAFEELVAELGAVMFAGHIGIDHVTRTDHVAYLQHWVKVLAEDPQALWTAATKASEAFEMLVGYSEAAAEEDHEEDLVAA
jgi:antirestriction protein ArdC